MSKLVKARPIAVEYLPEWAKCCEEFIEAQQDEGEMTLDLEKRYTMPVVCAFCHAPHGIRTGAIDIADGLYTELELVDLDEGPTTAERDRP